MSAENNSKSLAGGQLKSAIIKKQKFGQSLKFDGSEEPKNFKLLEQQSNFYNEIVNYARKIVITEMILATIFSACFTLIFTFLTLNEWTLTGGNFTHKIISQLSLAFLLISYVLMNLIWAFSLKPLLSLKTNHETEWNLVKKYATINFLFGWIPFLNIILFYISYLSLKAKKPDEDDDLNLWYQESIANVFSHHYANNVNSLANKCRRVLQENKSLLADNQGWLENMKTLQVLQNEQSMTLNNLQLAVGQLHAENTQLYDYILTTQNSTPIYYLPPTPKVTIVQPQIKNKKAVIRESKTNFNNKNQNDIKHDKGVRSAKKDETKDQENQLPPPKKHVIQPVLIKDNVVKLKLRIVDDHKKDDQNK